jgi:cysteine desulfurase
MEKRTVYLDHNATTPVRKEVLEAMLPYFTRQFGNASSVHTWGQDTRKVLEDSRETVAQLINAEKADEVIFTSGGTESDNMAIKGVAYANRARGNHIITTQIEHHAVLYTCEYLEQQGFAVTYLPVDKYGRVSPEAVLAAVTPQTILVTVMHANNEVGTIEPLEEIGALLRKENEARRARGLGMVYFHTDAVQTAGKLALDVQRLGVDLLSVSAHKFYGPKGVGMIYIRRGTELQPLMHGGHHERNYRAGTENIAGIVGMTAALSIDMKERENEQARLLALRKKLEDGITRTIPETVINGHPTERMPNTVNVSFKYIEGESLLLSLDLEGIAASAGSACASGSAEPSHVLKAMGISADVAQGTLRFSLGHDNTEADIDYVLEVLPPVVARLRSMSPLWKQAH